MVLGQFAQLIQAVTLLKPQKQLISQLLHHIMDSLLKLPIHLMVEEVMTRCEFGLNRLKYIILAKILENYK